MAYQESYTRHGKARKHPKHAFIWPKDGKRTSTLGRLADILTNKGPDIHVATHRGYAGNHNLGWDDPTRAQWSRWEHLPNHDPWDVNSTRGPPWWARRGAEVKYDFRTRKWRTHRPEMWSDVEWETGARTRDQVPRRWRASDGTWWNPQAGWVGVGPGMGAGW